MSPNEIAPAKSKPMGANGGFFFQSEVYRRKDGRFLHGARTPVEPGCDDYDGSVANDCCDNYDGSVANDCCDNYDGSAANDCCDNYDGPAANAAT